MYYENNHTSTYIFTKYQWCPCHKVVLPLPSHLFTVFFTLLDTHFKIHIKHNFITYIKRIYFLHKNLRVKYQVGHYGRPCITSFIIF